MSTPHEIFGFIIVDGNGALFATLQGNAKVILEKFTVDLPRKHGRGGQSQNRFERIRTEKRHNYLREITEAITEHFITDDQPNVRSLILAGSADLKYDIMKSDLFDPRLKPICLKVLDISYGGEIGLNQAIDLSSDILKGVKFLQEKKVLSQFYEEIAKDTGKYVFGIADTINNLLSGVIDKLILFEDLELYRVSFKDETVQFLKKEELSKIKTTEIEETILFAEWFIENALFKKYVNSLELVSNSSAEGTQFVNGFSGIGGILRFKIDLSPDYEEMNENLDEEDYFI